MKFTVNLAERMIAGRKKLNTSDELALKEANKLLQELNEEDQQILSRLNLDDNIRIASRVQSVDSRLAGYDQSRVFHISEIEKICKQYNLRFLETAYYQGTVDPMLAIKVKEFEKKYLGEHGSWKEVSKEVFTEQKALTYAEETKGWYAKYKKEDDKYWAMRIPPKHARYMIAAPRESFKLEKRPVDPLCFRQLEVDNYYYLIHKWGNDFSVARRLQGLFPIAWFFRAWDSALAFLALGMLSGLIGALIVYILGVIALGVGYITEEDVARIDLTMPILIVGTILWMIVVKLVGGKMQGDKWNSPFSDD